MRHYYKECPQCKGRGEVILIGDELRQRMKINDAIKEKNRMRKMEREKEKEQARQKYLEQFKSCPFCNGRNLHVDLNGREADWVRCDDCNCTGPVSNGERRAIMNWNKRPITA